MLVLIAILLALIPATAIAYPFLRRPTEATLMEEVGPLRSESSFRWDEALAGIRNAELEWSIGNLDERDYRWLREQYMMEATEVLKEMDLEDDEEREFLASIETERENGGVGDLPDDDG